MANKQDSKTPLVSLARYHIADLTQETKTKVRKAMKKLQESHKVKTFTTVKLLYL